MLLTFLPTTSKFLLKRLPKVIFMLKRLSSTSGKEVLQIAISCFSIKVFFLLSIFRNSINLLKRSIDGELRLQFGSSKEIVRRLVQPCQTLVTCLLVDRRLSSQSQGMFSKRGAPAYSMPRHWYSRRRQSPSYHHIECTRSLCLPELLLG